jgi:hypothetical protein
MIEDTRKDLQIQELETFLTEWVRRGKISGYVHYAQAIEKWIGLVTDGSPITSYVADEEEDTASIRKLTDIIISSHVDIKVLEQLRNLYKEISIRYVDRSKRNARFWDQLVSELNQSLNQYKAHSSIGSGTTSYIPIISHPELQIGNLTRDINGIRLPGTSDVVSHEPVDISITTHPAHNPHGGVSLSNPEFLDSTQNLRKLFRGGGIEQWIRTTEVPRIELQNVTYNGPVWDIELEYQGSIVFTSIHLAMRSKYPTTLCAIHTKLLDTDDWQLVKTNDGNWDHVEGTETIVVNDLVRTSARKVRIRLCQENYEVRNEDTNDYVWDGARQEDLAWLEGNQSFSRTEANVYDLDLTAIETGKNPTTPPPPGEFQYQIGLIGIDFIYDSFVSNGNGDFWTHPQEENAGLKIDSEPIEVVTIVPEQQTHELSTVEWWAEDIARRFQIPILPLGTTRVREPVNFIDQFTIQLTFPIAADTTPEIYLNGVSQTLTTREINSTEIDLGAVAVNRTDNYVVEYDLAVGHIVMGYVLVNDTTTTVVVSGGNNDTNSIFVNRQEADSWIVTNSNVNTLHSAPVMIRLDEYFYWFNNGEATNNVGRTATQIPNVYEAPDL